MTNDLIFQPNGTPDLKQTISENVHFSLLEDVGSADITAQLVPASQRSQARILTRQPMVLAGQAWVNEVFRQLDPTIEVNWLFEEGAHLQANDVFVEITGNSRTLLTGERTALNFLQTLSGVATRVRHHMSLLEGLPTRLLDTRKTIPGLRLALKYAVTLGGGHNHRMGLYDAFLIKENHIMAAGSIKAAVEQAHLIAPGKPVEVEVENFDELNEALSSGADIVMLDNFSNDEMRQAVALVAGRCKLEASGNITEANLRSVAETGVDYISMGTLTKDIYSIDLSMRMHHNI